MQNGRGGMLLGRVYWGAATLAYTVWLVYKIPKVPASELWFAAAAGAIFLFVYLLPQALFGARINPQPSGIQVSQYRQEFIPYSDIERCYSLFLFPFQTVVVITKRNFPLKILIAGDQINAKRKSLTQDGELAKILKAGMGSGTAAAGSNS